MREEMSDVVFWENRPEWEIGWFHDWLEGKLEVKPYGFNAQEVEDAVLKRATETDPAPGVYILGDVKNASLVSQRVGYAGKDLYSELMLKLEKVSFEGFLFDYASSEEHAYQLQCWLFHELHRRGFLKQQPHPEKPSGLAIIECIFCRS